MPRNRDKPYTHTQYEDKSTNEFEDECKPDRHHYIISDDETFAVCARCGASEDFDATD